MNRKKFDPLVIPVRPAQTLLVSILLGIGQDSLGNGDFETYNQIKPETIHGEFIYIKTEGSVGIIVFGNCGWLQERGSGFHDFSW